ncbi:MAG: FkbM family methyltransferase [Cyclobacteriaceae bacterium]|nr:FkbM family methyltransferase [Cyclobacteriaceae bacterium]
MKVSYFRFLRKQLHIQHTYPVELYKAVHHVSVRKGKTIPGDKVIEFRFKQESRDLSVLVRKGASDAAVFYQVFGIGEYQNFVDLIKSFPGVTIRSIVDAGANVGFTSLFFLANFPEASIVAIEPDDQNYELLTDNLTRNAPNQHVLLKRALWKNSDTVSIQNSFRDHREWSRQVTDTPETSANKLEGIPLRDLFHVTGTDQIDVLKIDIEGAEKEVFANTQDSIEVLRNVKFLVIELHDEVEFKHDFENILKQANFRFTYVGESLIGFNNTLLNECAE